MCCFIIIIFFFIIYCFTHGHLCGKVCVRHILQIIQVGCLQQDVGQSIHVFTVHGEVGHSGRRAEKEKDTVGGINTVHVVQDLKEEQVLVFIFHIFISLYLHSINVQKHINPANEIESPAQCISFLVLKQ